MIPIKTEKDIAIMAEGGKILSGILNKLAEAAVAGITTKELDSIALDLVLRSGTKPSFLGYVVGNKKFPASLCVSINDEVVHGIPNEKEKILKEGDIVGLDIGLKHKGLYVDMAVTVPVGDVDNEAQKLIDTTKEALKRAIDVCREGADLSEIGCAIESYVKPFGYGIVEDLGGHGVGHKIHELPYIRNYCLKEKMGILKVGMVLALEPMLNEGTHEVILDKDGYTYRTKDGKRSAHFEHTIVITKGEPEILTAF